MCLLDALVVLGGHVRMHVADHEYNPLLLALQAVHPVVEGAVPRDHLPLLPTVRLIRDDELRPLQAGDPQVDVQDVVCGPAVGLRVRALLHLDHHGLLILVGHPREVLGGKPLLQQRARVREDRLALLGEVPPVVEQHTVPVALVEEEAVGVLEAARVRLAQREPDLVADGLEVLLEPGGDREVVPGLAGPDPQAAQPAHPGLRRLVEVNPGDGVAGAVRPRRALPGHGGDLVEEGPRLVDLARVLVLQRDELGVQRDAAALELGLRVEVRPAVVVVHELLCERDPQLYEVVVPGGPVEAVLDDVEVEQQVRHVFQLPVVVRGVVHRPHALQGIRAELGVVAVAEVCAQLLHARVPQRAVLAVELVGVVREQRERVSLLLLGTSRAAAAAPEEENDGRPVVHLPADRRPPLGGGGPCGKTLS
mmetsp:Transcript_19290/g.54506  ORF Transcript_19290/g.54506 Transcript_19290/m.54506 type:complete len:422 (+) Transcript_19290:170-1435(+)